MNRATSVFAAALLVSGPAWAADPAAAGARAFQKCVSCHSTDPAERGLPGPSLAGIVGRAAARDPDFDYSPALRAAARAGLVWDAAKLDAYIADVAAVVPGTSMSFHGIPDAAERAVLIDWLRRR